MNTKQSLSRRQFIKSGAVLTAAAAVLEPQLTPPAIAAPAKKKIPIGVQLYSVRQNCAEDLPGTLKAIAKMGYEGVEFAGYYGRDAKTLRRMLDDLGLKCCGTHIGLDTLLGDNLQATVEFNKTLGNKFLIVPGLPEQYRGSKEAWLKTASVFNEIAEKLEPHKMRVGYHNHSAEFQPIDGELPWDLFFGNTKKSVVMQFDTGNAMHGGGDPVKFLKRYPGRAATVHLKPFSEKEPNALIGEDELPWKKILELCRTSGGTEWYIIEYESDKFTPLVSIEKCLNALKKII